MLSAVSRPDRLIIELINCKGSKDSPSRRRRSMAHEGSPSGVTEESKLRIDARQVKQHLRDGELALLLCVPIGEWNSSFFMNEPGDEKVAARDMREIFKT